MKTLLLGILLIFSVCGYSQIKGKILPIDRTILKLSEDTTTNTMVEKLLSSDYLIIINTKTNKKDTSLSYDGLIRIFDDKKRKKRF
jgi:hypothetical protein